jgi:hypothetical protein
MAHFNFQTHPGQGIHQFRAHPHRFVVSRKVEVAAHVMGYGVNAIRSIAPQEEELRL